MKRLNRQHKNLVIRRTEILQDKSGTGKERPWRAKKISNLLLSMVYEGVNQSKAMRLSQCGNFLQFKRLSSGGQKLHRMNSCCVRLCPICSWRRSLKLYAHMQKIMDAMNESEEYAYIFATFTIRNCAGSELKGTLDMMMNAWKAMQKNKAFKGVVVGWYRGLEITHNVDKSSPSYDTYHPHFHCVLAVKPSYFKSHDYLSQKQWTSLWQTSARLDYVPIVNVKRVKGETAKAVAEAAKYTVKESEYLIVDDWDLTTETVKIMDESLANRRLIGFGGVLKKWHKMLNLDDETKGSLTDVDSSVAEDGDDKLMTYAWNFGYSQYYRHEFAFIQLT